MNIPNLDIVSYEAEFGVYHSQPVYVPMLGKRCELSIEDYDEDKHPEDYHQAISLFLNSSVDVLKAAEPYLFQYYQTMNSCWNITDEEYLNIKSPEQIWDHIQLGNDAVVLRRAYGDRGIYISLACSCDWEPEHGLMIVFKQGNKICKVGPYDGHVTNSDAFADDSLEHIIYYTIV